MLRRDICLQKENLERAHLATKVVGEVGCLSIEQHGLKHFKEEELRNG